MYPLLLLWSVHDRGTATTRSEVKTRDTRGGLLGLLGLCHPDKPVA